MSGSRFFSCTLKIWKITCQWGEIPALCSNATQPLASLNFLISYGWFFSLLIHLLIKESQKTVSHTHRTFSKHNMRSSDRFSPTNRKHKIFHSWSKQKKAPNVRRWKHFFWQTNSLIIRIVPALIFTLSKWSVMSFLVW